MGHLLTLINPYGTEIKKKSFHISATLFCVGCRHGHMFTSECPVIETLTRQAFQFKLQLQNIHVFVSISTSAFRFFLLDQSSKGIYCCTKAKGSNCLLSE